MDRRPGRPSRGWRDVAGAGPRRIEDIAVRAAAVRTVSVRAITVRTVVARAMGVGAVAIVVILTGCTAAEPTTVTVPGTDEQGTAAVVSSVVDGDTIDVSFGDGPGERLRLLGIDTPETVKPNAPVDCFGPEASAATKELLAPGTTVVVQRDTEARDRYGRLLGYVWRKDGTFVNRSLVADGFARTLSIAPNTAHRGDLAAAAAEARIAGRGLWSACPPES